MDATEAVRRWRDFATSTQVAWAGTTRSWAAHIAGRGYIDEERLIQPVVFQLFADQLLGFKVGVNLAPERHDREGKPDFTPADAVTHPFVFETKSTRFGTITPDLDQVDRYLREGSPRIRSVVQTNLIAINVFKLDDHDQRTVDLTINLRGLLEGPLDFVAGTADARRLATFLEQFRFRTLSRPDKIARVRSSPPWNPQFEATDSDWLSRRLDSVVEVLKSDVHSQVAHGALDDPTLATASDRTAIVDELRELEWRIAANPPDPNTHELVDYLGARGDSDEGKAVRQYEAHVAYFAATRLLLVRIWEDLNLLAPVLYDGGFDGWMTQLQGAVNRVVDVSFLGARDRYPSLFEQRNTYTWFRPGADAYVDAIYELANTYFGSIESDVLGVVYERLLDRVDRKLLGQYYTPRDVIRVIWDMLGAEQLAEAAEARGVLVRVLDIATGSGGFLVEAARRLRERFEGQQAAGAIQTPAQWLAAMASHLVGVEIQRFPAYLAELNLLIQLGLLTAPPPAPRIPAVGVLHHDTLSLHNPERQIIPFGVPHPPVATPVLAPDDAARADAYMAAKDPQGVGGAWFDAAVGNPPYVGEKKLAGTLVRTRARYPYWDRFIGRHMDYLYWFLILGVSKLRQGGRFGFITTEYWLRAEGARPLRAYLATRCRIDRILLFRNLRLFPDAPGQHSMIIVGERVALPDPEIPTDGLAVRSMRPRVSIYRGVHTGRRADVLAALKAGRSTFGVQSFQSSVSPNFMGGGSWSEVVLSAAQLARRRRVRAAAQPIELRMAEGVISGADRLSAVDERHMTALQLSTAGGPGSRHGIFVLTPTEVAALGSPTADESAALRRIANTRDVYPYATVIAPDGTSLIYLPRPAAAVTTGLSGDAVRNLPFPARMPAFERHLRVFEQVLATKVARYGERRPWWSIHRDRAEIIGRDGTAGRWADYALTTRWGVGDRLLVGLAPRGSVPASGLHALLPVEPATAAYVVGLMNATAVQQLADTLPPGELRQTDFQELGLPLLAIAEATRVAVLASELADVVVALVTQHAARWPLLSSALREDVALGSVPTEAWQPEPGPATTWGTVSTVAWTDIERTGAYGRKIAIVEVERTVLGLAVRLTDERDSTARIRVVWPEESIANAVAMAVRGYAARGGTIAGVGGLPLPIDPRQLGRQLADDRRDLDQTVDAYRAKRAEIDAIVDLAV